MSAPLFAFITPQTLIIVGLIGMILYGNKLPEMGRILAQSIKGFKDTLSGREDDRDELVRAPAAAPVAALPRPPERVTASSVNAVERNGTAESPMV